MKITPKVEFEKNDIGLGIIFVRSNDSKKYIRKYKTITYTFGIIFLCFTFAIIIELEKGERK